MDFLIKGIDHCVITVADSDRTTAFYRDILGMEIERFGENRLAIRVGKQKINIHVTGEEILPHAAHPTPGSVDLCFLSAMPVSRILSALEKRNVPVELGPVERTGACGKLLSLYIRDPDGNLIEIANQIE